MTSHLLAASRYRRWQLVLCGVRTVGYLKKNGASTLDTVSTPNRGTFAFLQAAMGSLEAWRFTSWGVSYSGGKSCMNKYVAIVGAGVLAACTAAAQEVPKFGAYLGYQFVRFG